MIVALWAPVYFVLVESFGLESMPRSELLQWGLVAVGVSGLASILFTAWRDTRDPAWRIAHRLPPLRSARIAGTSPAFAPPGSSLAPVVSKIASVKNGGAVRVLNKRDPDGQAIDVADWRHRYGFRGQQIAFADSAVTGNVDVTTN
jgi:hypothetical protein